jgi:hypothetical protein
MASMAPAFLQRWLHGRPSETAASATPQRRLPWHGLIQACWPDSTLTYRNGRRLRPALGESSLPPSMSLLPAGALESARTDFLLALSDLTDQDCANLRERITHATSLTSLWHWRAEVYAQVSLARDQREAQARLAQLSRHFPQAEPPISPRPQGLARLNPFDSATGSLR